MYVNLREKNLDGVHKKGGVKTAVAAWWRVNETANGKLKAVVADGLLVYTLKYFIFYDGDGVCCVSVLSLGRPGQPSLPTLKEQNQTCGNAENQQQGRPERHPQTCQKATSGFTLLVVYLVDTRLQLPTPGDHPKHPCFL